MYEEYCSPYCDFGYEILGSNEEYMNCNLATGWQWSHVVDGNPPPICMRRYHFKYIFLMLNASRYSPSLFPTRTRCYFFSKLSNIYCSHLIVISFTNSTYFDGTISYVGTECSGMTEEEKDQAMSQ